MIIIKYETEEEAQQIIINQTTQGMTLIEVSNITEGNFLGFREPTDPQPVINPTIEEKLLILETQIKVNEELTMVAMEAIAGLSEGGAI